MRRRPAADRRRGPLDRPGAPLAALAAAGPAIDSHGRRRL